MYPYVGNMSSYDLVGLIGLVFTSIYSYFTIKKSNCFPGRYSLFFIVYFSKKKQKGIVRILSSISFWKKIEKSVVLFSIIFTFSIGERIFRESFTFVNRDYYNILLLTPLLLLFVFYIFRLNFLMFIDSMTPIFALYSFVLKHACFFHGCCYGYECTWGFYNYKTDATEFPIQLVEAYFSLLIFFIILFYKKRNNNPGILFPLFLNLYSLGRLGISFFRACDKEVLSFLTDYQIRSIIGLFVGIVLLIFFSKIKYFLSILHNRSPFPGYMRYKETHHKRSLRSKKRK